MLKHLFNKSNENHDKENIHNLYPHSFKGNNNVVLTHTKTCPIKPTFLKNIIWVLNNYYPQKFETALHHSDDTVRKSFLSFLEYDNDFIDTPMHNNRKIAKLVYDNLFNLSIIHYLLKYHPNITEFTYDGKVLRYIDNGHVYKYGNQIGENSKYLATVIINFIIYQLSNNHIINSSNPLYDGKYKDWDVHITNSSLTPIHYNSCFTMSKHNQVIKPHKSTDSIWTNNKLIPLKTNFVKRIFTNLQTSYPKLINKLYNVDNLGEYYVYRTQMKNIISKNKLMPKQNNNQITDILFVDMFKLDIIHRLLQVIPDLNTFIIYGDSITYGIINTHIHILKGIKIINLIDANLITKALTHNHDVSARHPSYSGIYNIIWHFKINYLNNDKKSIIMRRS